MMRFKRAGALVALLLGGLLVSACSVSVNTGSTPTPTATPAPTPTPKVVSVVITESLDSARCETSAAVTILIDGHDVGTLKVDGQSIPADRLTVMMTPASHKYSLKGTAFFQVNGQTFSLNASGKGEEQVNDGTNSWTLTVDGSRLTTGGCPAGGGTWPLVLQT